MTFNVHCRGHRRTCQLKWLVNTTLCMFWLLRMFFTRTKMKWNLSHWLTWGGHKISLTLGQRYTKIRNIHFYILLSLANSVVPISRIFLIFDLRSWHFSDRSGISQRAQFQAPLIFNGFVQVLQYCACAHKRHGTRAIRHKLTAEGREPFQFSLSCAFETANR